TGSGKSTTLAALLHEMNRTRPQHVVTIEDPIEFVHKNRRSLFSQKEIGTHARSFSEALRMALREDPDVILVGEMRDLETIEIALNAADTGLLVLGTLHTNSAAKTIDRIISVFPASRIDEVRGLLANGLKAIVAQQLLNRKGGGRVAAIEVLLSTPALASCIREGKSHQIPDIISSGKRL
ncbi:MAG: Flp pilus assembly complex ATPase component TadA, partial [Ottowia sp.]|nr:Flp pilus assembly complex ATPase component TadA [Ottowia sp.]